MQLELKCFQSLCELEVFNINGIRADYDDFGTKRDTDSRNAEAYCCNNMQFTPKPATKAVLDRYRITVAEYNQICEELKCLSFGACSMCL